MDQHRIEVELIPLASSQCDKKAPWLQDRESLDMLGVSVNHLQTEFMEQVYAAGHTAASKIYEIEDLSSVNPGVIRRRGAEICCPIDHRIGASYVHSISGEEHVGPADFMLSYSWGYTIGDICDALHNFCISQGRDPRRTYVWICCLCVNQHRVVENRVSGRNIPPEEFFAKFGDRVTGIGHILAMMAPWENPAYLVSDAPPCLVHYFRFDLPTNSYSWTTKTRVWCIFELYTAHKEGCEVIIIMPAAQKKSLKQVLFGSSTGERNRRLDVLYNVLAKTRVENAEASVEEDRTTILDLVKTTPGYKTLNNHINDLLRGWVKDVVTELVEGEDEAYNASRSTSFATMCQMRCCMGKRYREAVQYATLCNDVGLLFRRNGEHEAAMELWRKSLSIRETLLGTSNPDTADSYKNIAGVLQAKGDFNQALVMYKKAHAIEIAVLGSNHPSTGLSYNNIGCIYRAKGNHDEALKMYKKALAIQQFNLGEDHSLTATSYNNIGSVLKAKGDFVGALQMHKKALTIKMTELGANHPDTATSYNNVGSVLKAKGDHAGALEMYKKALSIEESVLGVNHLSTARSYNNIGSVLLTNGEHDQALIEFQRALAIHKSLLGENHPSSATSHNNIGSALHAKGEYDEALEEFNRALAIQKLFLGANHPHTKSTKKWIGRVLAKKFLAYE